MVGKEMESLAHEAIAAIHALAGSEVAFNYVLNNPVRGIKGATKTMETNRLHAFKLMVQREPTDEEKQALLFGDS